MFGDYSYMLTPLGRDELDDFLTRRSFCGINVTIPYKKAVIPYCEQLDEVALRTGSVNTVINCDGRLFGYNTDYYGFRSMAERAGISAEGKSAVILGSGGTSLTAACALEDMGASEINVVSRSGRINYSNLSLCENAEILVNTTPVGMYPDMDESPVTLSSFPKCSGIIDVIYNPMRTRLLLQAKAAGIPYTNGLPMLVYQAKRAAELFTGRAIPDERAEYVISALSRELRAIALIGMPGCGKSVTGKILSRLTGMPLVDTDAEIEKRCGMSILEIFARHGEEFFRSRECEVIRDVTATGGKIIATGGGAIENAANRAALASNAEVIYIKRELSQLPCVNRPLSSDTNKIYAMYKRRAPFYEECADYTVCNCQTADKLAEEIMEKLGIDCVMPDKNE